MLQKILMTVFISFFISGVPGFTQEIEKTETLSLGQFIETACARDKVFEEILIDNLKLNYKKALELPAGDIVISSKSEYVALIKEHDKGFPAYEISLSKLFPYTGTELETGFSSSRSAAALGTLDAEIYAKITQPIARDAFGKATRLLDKIVGMEIEIVKYQIVEAYEKYLSSIIHIYYDWYEAYENVKTAENSYNENMKLLKNVQEREKNNIALPVDVNKVKLQVLAKEEALVSLRSQYDEYTNLLKKSIGYDVEKDLLPSSVDQYDNVVIGFEEDYRKFKEESRTSLILDMIEKKTDLEIDKDADDLLPSIDLFAEYSVAADDRRFEKDFKTAIVGISLEYPFLGEVEKAEYETSKIEHDKSKLDKVNTHISIYTDLRNIYREIVKTKELIRISEEKIGVAQSIVDDDTVNYSYGKVILNNFIDEVNRLDLNKFSRIQYSIKLKKLIIDWLALTDQLIRGKELEL